MKRWKALLLVLFAFAIPAAIYGPVLIRNASSPTKDPPPLHTIAPPPPQNHPLPPNPQTHTPLPPINPLPGPPNPCAHGPRALPGGSTNNFPAPTFAASTTPSTPAPGRRRSTVPFFQSLVSRDSFQLTFRAILSNILAKHSTGAAPYGRSQHDGVSSLRSHRSGIPGDWCGARIGPRDFSRIGSRWFRCRAGLA